MEASNIPQAQESTTGSEECESYKFFFSITGVLFIMSTYH
jgi:hypothetical protein